MILDSSAVIAIVTGEAEAELFSRLATATTCRMSVGNWLECHVVADRRWPDQLPILEAVLATLDPELVGVDAQQAQVARQAHQRFGPGSGSPARLNYGDCFAYALAVTTGDTLLFKGDDFAHTDVRPAAPDQG